MLHAEYKCTARGVQVHCHTVLKKKSALSHGVQVCLHIEYKCVARGDTYSTHEEYKRTTDGEYKYTTVLYVEEYKYTKIHQNISTWDLTSKMSTQGTQR